MISSPPPLQTVRHAPVGLSIVAGLAGIAAAIGAGSSGFFRQLISFGQIDFYWGSVLQVAAIVALVGAVLALLGHEGGGPVLAGSGSTIAVVVATTVASERFEMEAFLDDYPLRGLLFLGAGLAGTAAAVLGLVGLRGRGKPAVAAVAALLGVGVLACHAALFRLDDRREAFVVRPFVGIAVIVGVMVIGCFVGRAGALAAAAGAACLLPLYSELAENDGFPRVQAAVVAAVACAAIVAVSLVAAVLASREKAMEYFDQTQTSGAWAPQFSTAQFPPTQLGATNVHHAQPFSPAVGTQPTWASPPFGSAADVTTSYRTPAYGSPAYEPTQQLPPITESTSAMGTFFEPQYGAVDSATSTSAEAQWASDPYGRHQLRYWDGGQWTEHVSNGGVSGTDPV